MVQAFKRTDKAFAALKKKLVGKDTEFDCIERALMLKQHCLFIGPHGIAKSMAIDLTFDAFGKSVPTFRLPLFSGTQPFQVLGPEDIPSFKGEVSGQSELRFNTDGYLPTARLAYLDEVYRASGLLLPSVMTIMNERRFSNGTSVEPCPLWSLFGATNHVPLQDDDLHAFHDRWLLSLNCQPVDASESYLLISDPPKTDTKVSLRMSDFEVINRALKDIVIPRDLAVLYANLRKSIMTRTRGYVSDRRFVQGADLLRLAGLCNLAQSPTADPDDPDEWTIPEDGFATCLAECSFVLGPKGDKDTEESVTNFINNSFNAQGQQAAQSSQLTQVMNLRKSYQNLVGQTIGTQRSARLSELKRQVEMAMLAPGMDEYLNELTKLNEDIESLRSA